MKLKQILFTLAFVVIAGQGLFAQTEVSDCDKYKSLYFQYLKQDMYRDAASFWAQAYGYCGWDGTDRKFFSNGRAAYLKLWAAEKDEAKKTQYRDTLYWIYESLILKDAEPADWKGKYATMLVNENDPRLDKIDSLYWGNVHVLKGKTAPSEIRTYFKHLIVNRFNPAPAEKKEEVRNFVIDEYMLLSEYCTEGVKIATDAGDTTNAKRYKDAQDFLDTYFLKIVTDCQTLTNVVDKKIASLPQDKAAKTEKVNAYLKLLQTKKCETTETYGKLLDTLLLIEPNAAAYFETGKYYLINKQESKSVDYLQKAVELEGEGVNKHEYLYYLAVAQYSSGRYKAAFSTAKLVKGEREGAALKICGDCIVRTADGCGETTFQRKANIWLANDYYSRAKALGEDVSSKGGAPTQEEAFNEGVSAGASVYCSCWGESTTARF